jgi:hypothetical protein
MARFPEAKREWSRSPQEKLPHKLVDFWAAFCPAVNAVVAHL